MNKTKTRIILAAAIILWMGLIFYMSSRDATASSAMSGGLIERVASIFPTFRHMSVDARQGIIDGLQFIVRKSAHATIYLMLGALVFPFCKTFSEKPLTAAGTSAAVCLLYAISDEIHQRFIPGRSCELRDVIVDLSGALVGIAVMVLLRKLYLKCRAKRR